MRIYLKQYIFRIVSALVITLCFLILSLNFYVNYRIRDYKRIFSEQLSKYFESQVVIEKVKYSFPNVIKIKKISAFKKDSLTKNLTIPLVKLNFSWADYLLKKKIILTSINLYKINLFDARCILTADIADFLKQLGFFVPEKNLKLRLKDVRYCLNQGKSKIDLLGDFYTKIESNGNIISKGKVSLDDSSRYKKYPDDFLLFSSKYELKAFISKKGIDITSLEIKNNNYFTNLWGMVDYNNLKLNGFFTNNRFLKYPTLVKQKPSLISKIKRFLFSKGEFPVKYLNPSVVKPNIYDFSIDLSFDKQKINFDEIRFSLNKIVFFIKGYISLEDVIKLDLLSSAFISKTIPNSAHKTSKKIDFHLLGQIDDGFYCGNFDIDISDISSSKIVNYKIKSILDKFNLKSGSGLVAEFNLGKGDFAIFIDDTVYKFIINDLVGWFYLGEKDKKLIELRANVYDGKLKATGVVDLGKFPMDMHFKINISDLSSDSLKGISGYFLKIKGIINSQIDCYFRNFTEEIRGNFYMRNGLLDNLSFFVWLAGFFNMPSVAVLNFNEIYGEFVFTDKQVGFNQLKLDSKDLDFNGNFMLGDKSMVSSILSLDFSKNLMQSSPKFRSLLRILGDKATSISFDFQLSGLINRMNFKWLESDFKNELKSLLPGFIERSIEKRVEDIMQDFSSN